MLASFVQEAPMQRRILVMLIAAGCLAAALSCGVSAVALQSGLVRPPLFSARVGGWQVATYTERIISNIHPPHVYFTVWVFSYPPPRAGQRPPRTPVWGRRLVQIEIAESPRR
jgi:hypothetical protein